ncbi:YraN family protein [Helcococcus ovis]|uniref:YraN family protein n=2 Tax=Helcococcus ovis TaxID=72026 RepID=UPI0038BBA95F
MNKLMGKLGEEIACRYLIKNDYKILERNYATKFAEVDIIAIKNMTIVIVEVKTRKNSDVLHASQAVDYRKIKKLKTIALYYIDQNNLYDYNLRFDIIECYWQSKKINHIINAF